MRPAESKSERKRSCPDCSKSLLSTSCAGSRHRSLPSPRGLDRLSFLGLHFSPGRRLLSGTMSLQTLRGYVAIESKTCYEYHIETFLSPFLGICSSTHAQANTLKPLAWCLSKIRDSLVLGPPTAHHFARSACHWIITGLGRALLRKFCSRFCVANQRLLAFSSFDLDHRYLSTLDGASTPIKQARRPPLAGTGKRP